MKMQGSLINRMMDASRNTTNRYEGIKVGMGATETMWSDRHAGTVVAVRYAKDGVTVKEIDWQRDKTTRLDSHGMSDSQHYSYAPDPSAPVQTWRVDRDGRFRQLVNERVYDEHGTFVRIRVRLASKSGGSRLILDVRDEHYDYSF